MPATGIENVTPLGQMNQELKKASLNDVNTENKVSMFLHLYRPYSI